MRRGLLFAGTEQAIYVSFDDGDNWQSLRLNMPATSMRDLVIKDDDIAVGTHGRSFWILDDITPLRQITQDVTARDAHLFEPQQAWRFRWNKNTDTPLPQGEPVGENPPDGAIFNYYLGTDARGPVTLEILTESGEIIRRFSSDDPPEPPLEGQNVPDYWPRPPQVLSAEAGLHRFVWDLHYPRPAVLRFGYPIAAVPYNTPVTPFGSWVLPGRYTVRLTVNGTTHSQPLTVNMDPRVKTPAAELERQFRLSRKLDALLREDFEALEAVQAFRANRSNSARDSEAAEIESSLRQLNGTLGSLFSMVERVDKPPTSQVVTAIGDSELELRAILSRWQALQRR